MWPFLANLIGGPIVKLFGGPVIKGLLDGYKAKLDAGNTSERIAADLAQRELSVQQAEIAAQTQLRIAQIGKWYEPEHLFGYTLFIYFAKIIIWDKVLALGSTDALRGDISDWAGLIIISYFGKRGIENVVRILKK